MPYESVSLDIDPLNGEEISVVLHREYNPKRPSRIEICPSFNLLQVTYPRFVLQRRSIFQKLEYHFLVVLMMDHRLIYPP